MIHRLFRFNVQKVFFFVIASALFLHGCISHSPKTNLSSSIIDQSSYQLHPLRDPLATQFGLQGLSGLVFQKEEKGRLFFWTLTDRGPNLDAEKNGAGEIVRPFLNPDFNPQILLFSVSASANDIQLEKVVELKDSQGHAIHGLPPTERCQTEEIPVDSTGRSLPCESLGIDSESLAVDEQGNFWVGDEYGPSLFQFSAEGRLIKRYIPNSQNKTSVKTSRRQKNKSIVTHAILPKMVQTREPNKGFEGLAMNGKYLFAILQSPLPKGDLNPHPDHIPILKIDTSKNEVVETFWYPADLGKSSRIGDMSILNDQELLIIEQNSKVGPSSVHKIYRVLLTKSQPTQVANQFEAVRKVLLLDLVSVGYDTFEKVEGLALIKKNQLAVVNDNDFGVYVAEGAKPLTVLSIYDLGESKSL